MAEPLQFLIKSAFDATGINSAVNSVNRIDSQISKVSRGLTKFAGLMGAGGIGLALAGFAKSSIESFGKQENAIAKMNSALKAQGVYSDSLSRKLQGVASNIQRVTTVADDDATSMMQLGLSMGISADNIEEATKQAIGMSKAYNVDLNSAMKMVALAMQGEYTMMNRYIPQLRSLTSNSEKAALTKKLLADGFSMAEAEAKTTLGTLKQLANQVDDLKERVGEFLLPVLNFWADKLKIIIDRVEKLAGAERIESTENMTQYEKRLSAVNRDIAAQKTLIDLQSSYRKDIGTPGGKGHLFDQDALNRASKVYATLIDQRKELTKLVAAERANKPAGGTGGGSLSPTTNEVGVIDQASIAWEQSHRSMVQYYTDARGLRYEFVSAIQPTAELQKRVDKETWKEINLNWRAAVKQNKNTTQAIEAEWERGSRTFSGGFQQAILEAQMAMDNWRGAWQSVISGSIGPAQAAIHNFFTKSSQGFLNFGKLAKSVFQGIRDAFFRILEEMAAKALIMGFFKILGLVFAPATGGGSMMMSNPSLNLLTRKGGGLIPGSGAVPILAHGGEYVLSADVVNAIRTGAPSAGLGSRAVASAGRSATVNINQSVNITGGASAGDVKEICRKIAEATRNGVTSALDLAKVSYKTGLAKSGETAL